LEVAILRASPGQPGATAPRGALPPAWRYRARMKVGIVELALVASAVILFWAKVDGWG
jgi:hypothetical protein